MTSMIDKSFCAQRLTGVEHTLEMIKRISHLPRRPTSHMVFIAAKRMHTCTSYAAQITFHQLRKFNRNFTIRLQEYLCTVQRELCNLRCRLFSFPSAVKSRCRQAQLHPFPSPFILLPIITHSPGNVTFFLAANMVY